MSAKAILLVIVNFLCVVALYGADLSKQDQDKLRKAFTKGQESFLIPPYFEGGVNGYTRYDIYANAPPELKTPRAADANPDLRLLRGDKVMIERVNARSDYFELVIKTIEKKTSSFTPGQKLVGTLFLGLPGLAATQGTYSMQVDVKLRFYGKSAEEVQSLAASILSAEQPSTDLKPGMSPDEVRKIVGDPKEIITFGNKKTFRYPNMDVVFLEDKLESVALHDTAIKK